MTRIRPASLPAIFLTWPSATTTSFIGDRYKWNLRFTIINLTNNYALYNFLSTFSGTHYVTPRTYRPDWVSLFSWLARNERQLWQSPFIFHPDN